MPDTDGEARLTASGFAALRTPLLPYAEATALSEGLHAAGAAPDALAAAVDHDRILIGERLRSALARPEIRDALVVASPDLIGAVERWEQDEATDAQRVEHATFRYLTRMATRCTPFGLFAAASTLPTGDRTRLELGPRTAYQRHTRLDMDYLVGLVDALARQPDVRAGATYRLNSSSYRIAGNMRYVESRWDGKRRTHHLVAVTATDHLRTVLAAAAGGAKPAELAASLHPFGVDDDHASRYVDSLIDAQLLVPDLEPAITGEEPLGRLVTALGANAATKDAGDQLAEVARQLSDLDETGVGVSPERYHAVATRLATLPREVLPGRLVQVDLVKPAHGSLGKDVVDEVARAVRVLHRLSRWAPDEELTRFRERFQERYDGRVVPLMEALDGEHGVGLGATPASPPLLRGLAFPAAQDARQKLGPRDRVLLSWLGGLLQRGEHELALTPSDVDELAAPDPPPLPPALAAAATIAAPSAAAVERGRFQLVVHGVAGPSGARLLGRFCHADDQLRAWVERHLREEEALDPDAVFAEVAHLPEDRLGNILLRPVLREYEIGYLGRSGAPEDRQLPVSDLLVAVRGGQLTLFSQRLGRRVVPRLTAAHDFTWRSQPAYRFLTALQDDGVAGALGWSWGALDSSPFLPRVRFGRLVLSRARWRLDRAELSRLGGCGEGAALFAAVSRWRAERGVPRMVVLADYDNALLVDLDNVVAVESFVRLVRRRDQAVLEEVLPDAGQLCCSGPEGAFAHELVVPFVVGEPKTAGVAVPMPTSARRSFPPGSEWLYAKLYCGPVTTDRLLRDLVAPLRESVLDSGAADRWFFVRYADPDEHLRLRFHGEPHALRAVRDELERACTEVMRSGRAWRLVFDTYERETERYGGPAGMPIAEEIFAADSDVVLELLRRIGRGEQGEQERWRLAVRSVDDLLDDLGLGLPSKLRVMRAARAAFAAEHRMDGKLSGQIGRRYRQERAELERLLDRSADVDSPLAPGLAILRERSEQLAPIVARLHDVERAGQLSAPVEHIAPSLVHLHLNRLLRTRHRRQELVLSTFLTRLYEARSARQRGRR